MLVIGICDINPSHRGIIKNLIEAVFFDQSEISVSEYDKAEKLIQAIGMGNLSFDLVILDVASCGGLSIPEYFKNGDIHTDVIVYSDTPAFVFDGYRYGLFDYVLKQPSLENLQESLTRYIAEKLNCMTEYLSVRTNGCMQNIRLDKVTYFESRGRKIAAVSMEEKFEFYQKMDELLAVLPIGSFVRCHQSYTVNIKAIYSYSSSSIVLKNGQSIPVSRKYYQDLKMIFEPSNLSEKQSIIT